MSTSQTISLADLGTFRDYVALTKPRVTTLVLITMAGGMWLAPQTPSLAVVFAALLGTATVVGSANALNCWIERDADRLMARTASRPLPAGRMHPRHALIFGTCLGLISVPMLTFLVNPLTGLVGAAALISYVAVYTPLKQKSPVALLIGAVPGALPPLMGWTAATSRLEAPAVVLFLILFLWQIPHFIAIAIFRQEDYTRAGMKVLPAVYGAQTAKIHAVFWATILIPVSLLLVPMGVAGTAYLVTALALGLFFLAVTLVGLKSTAGRRWARQLFFASLLYLTLLFVVLIVDAGIGNR
ncbi:MAG: heme o synthase [Myxococcota bacterium]